MANQLQTVLGFIAIALLVSAASAQTFARDAASVPEAPSGDALLGAPMPEELTGAPMAEMQDIEPATLGTLEGPAFDLGTSDPSNAAATEEDDFTGVSPATVLGAVGLDGPLLNASSSQAVEANAICGANSLQSSNIREVCSLVSNWRFGRDTTCSGYIVGDRYIATAGHCLYDRNRGGYVRSVRIYCNSYNGCRRRPQTTRSVSVAVTTNWLNGDTRVTSPWDGGIIKTRDVLPYPPVRWGERTAGRSSSVYTAGYPGRQGESRNSPCRNFPEYTGCTQFASFGSMPNNLFNGFFRPDYDTCEGHAGGPLYIRFPFGSVVVGIQVGGGYDFPCRNLAVPLRVTGVDAGCNHPGGGVGINCLVTAANLRDRR